jgi:hypothetical protein
MIENGVGLCWDNEQKTVLRYTFVGDWTWDEYLERLNEGRNMMAEVEHSVCILNDMQKIGKLPPNFASTAKSVISSRPKNTGLAIFVTSNAFFKVMYRVLAQLIPNVPTEYILVTTEEEAYRKFDKWLTEHSEP